MQNIQTKFIYNHDKPGVINFFSKKKSIFIPLLLILLYIIFYFIIDFSSQSLVAHDEGLYARRSRLIEETSNWFSSPFSTPHHKTLGSYWFIALSIKLFGKSELALRLPSILASFICLFISYLIALKISNKKSALISVFSLSAMPLWIQYSRYASPDVLFVLCILIVILFFLKFLDSDKFLNKNFYIFISGLFISTAFFIRSYMVFVPIISLSPFLLFHLIRARTVIKTFFCTGIVVGAIPSILNLYFSYKEFGIEGITSLFYFAKKQAIGGFDFNNLLLIPLNYLYLTFPIGIFIIILFIFTRSNYKIKYPLLTYCYPVLSLLILLCMSTSYPHYYLFLLPSLSILFAIRLQTYKFRFSSSKKTIKYVLISLFILIIFTLLFIFFYYYSSFIQYSFGRGLFVCIVTFILVCSLLYSFRFLLEIRNIRFNLINFFYSIVVPQYVSISLLYNFGIIGNPNLRTKLFLNDSYVSSIINSNTIYLYNIDTKIETLLSYYLPSSKILKPSDDYTVFNYIITSDINFINNHQNNSVFKLVKRFDNHFLLKNISE